MKPLSFTPVYFSQVESGELAGCWAPNARAFRSYKVDMATPELMQIIKEGGSVVIVDPKIDARSHQDMLEKLTGLPRLASPPDVNLPKLPAPPDRDGSPSNRPWYRQGSRY